ncbi:hypothetical protein ES708_25828 [subsurface metagenome]
MEQRIVALSTVTIPSENTPEKKRTGTLVASPKWKYRGLADTIKFEWAIGQWKAGAFDKITPSRTVNKSQPKSDEWAEFETDLPAISLSNLSPRDEPYVAEIWFRDKFSDLCVRVEDCVKIVTVPEVYAGTITQKKLKYKLSLFDWTPLKTIPVSDIPLDSKVRLHITGRNDTDSYQSLGIHWLVYDPDGAIIRNYEDWSHHHCPGCDHTFVTSVGKEFSLNKTGTYTIKVALSMNPDDPVIVDPYIGDLCTVEEAPGLEPPEVKILAADNIQDKSATLHGKLIDTGFWSRVDVFFEFNGSKTAKVRMDEGDEGDEFEADLSGLTPDTTYDYRAGVDAVGDRSDEMDTQYSEYKSFTTSKEVVKGFTMRVINPKPTADRWVAGDRGGDPDKPYTDGYVDINETWHWDGLVPDETIGFYIMVMPASGPYLSYDEFDIRLRAEKNYVYDLAAHKMGEE